MGHCVHLASHSGNHVGGRGSFSYLPTQKVSVVGGGTPDTPISEAGCDRSPLIYPGRGWDWSGALRNGRSYEAIKKLNRDAMSQHPTLGIQSDILAAVVAYNS
jgi:hypothetical protein